MKIAVLDYEYDEPAVKDFWATVELIKKDTEYKATRNEYCKYCKG